MVVLKLTILIAEFLGYALILRRFSRLPLAVAPPVIASALILLLYTMDFVVSMKPISILLHIGGVVALLFYIVMEVKAKSILRFQFEAQFPLIVIVACGLFVIFQLFFLNSSGAFHDWDEFSHWGTIIYAVYEANTFILNPNPLYFQDYPPGTAIFSYHLLSILGYTEGNAYFSYSMLLLCFAAPIIGAAFTRSVAIGLGVFALIFYLVIALGNGWASVLIDHILSMVFAGAIVSYFVLQKSGRGLAFIPIILAALVLMKHAGSSLAILAAAICSVDWVILRCTEKQHIISGFRLSLFRYKDILWVGGLFFLPFLVSISWKSYVSLSGLNEGWGNASVLEFLNLSFSCCSASREIEVAGKFLAMFFDLDIPFTQAGSLVDFVSEAVGRLSVRDLILNSAEFAVGKVILVLSVLGIGAAFFFRTPARRLRFAILSIALTSGALLYSASLLLTYLYGFSDYEARILISFSRYHNVFLLAWSLILVYVMIELLSDLVSQSSHQFLLLIVVAVSFWTFPSTAVKANKFIKDGAPQASGQRIAVKEFVAGVEPYIPEGASVYITWYGSNGWEFWMIKHELLPRLTNKFCFSLGPKLNSDDLYTCDFDTSILKDYEYFVIGKGLQVLLDHHGSFFENTPKHLDAALFKVKKSEDSVRLVYIENRGL